MRPFVFFSGQLCRLIGLYGWISEYLKLKCIFYFVLIKLNIRGYEREKIYKITKRFFYLKINIPRKRKERKTQLMMNDLIVKMSEDFGIPQYQVREFLKEKFYME